MKNTVLLLCAITLSAAGNAQAVKSGACKKRVNTNGAGFYQNKGQIVDQDNMPNPTVKYLYNGSGMNVQLRTTGFSYDTYTDTPDPSQPCPSGESLALNKFQAPSSFTRHFHRIDVDIIGCNANAEIVAEDKSAAYYNYFTAGLPQGGVADVHTFQRVTYKNIYPNIDLAFFIAPSPRGEGRAVEYNFIVHPGGDYKQIVLKYNGADGIKLQNGEIIITTSNGNISETIPSSYMADTKQPVGVNYVSLTSPNGDGRGGNIFGFSIPSLQSVSAACKSDLVIDPIPSLLWGTYYGGSGSDQGYGIALDGGDNVYITGQTTSTGNIATAGAYKTVYSGGANGNAFVAKFDPTGATLLWGTYYGGAGLDEGTGIAVDATGNVYITGVTESTAGIATAGTYQTVYGGGTQDAFIAEFNSTGTSLLWGTYYGNGWTFGGSIVLDASGNVYVTGSTLGAASNIATANAYQTSNVGGSNAFVAEFNPGLSGNAQLVWGTFYGGTGGNSIAQGIALDASDNVYITGVTPSMSGIATIGAYNTTGDANDNAFVAKFNPSLSGNAQLVWGTYYGDTGEEDYGYGIAVDATNNVYITGFTQGGAGMTTAGAYQTVFGGGLFDVFAAKFNSTGTSLLWGTYYGGTGLDEGYNLALDASGNVFISGYTQSANAVATAGAYQTAFSGTDDAFIAMFNPALSGNAQLVWGTYYGATGINIAKNMALDAGGNVYITGLTQSTSGMTTVGAYQTVLGGTENAFVAKFSSCVGAPAQPAAISGPDTVCNGNMATYKIAPVAGAASYTWTLPAGWAGASTVDSIVATAGASGGTISVTATNACGTSVAQTLDVNVNDIGVTITPVNDMCNGVCNGTATANPAGEGPFNYVWSNASTSVSISSLCIGSYTVTITGAGGCTANANVTITQPAALNITQGSIPCSTASSCDGSVWAVVNGGTAPYTYLWNPGGATSDTVKNACDGQYCCHITDHNGCTDSVCVSIATGIPTVADISSVKIYPNPFSQSVNVDVNIDGPVTITIYTMIGQNIGEWQADKGMNTINTSAIPSGIYLMQIKTPKTILNKKLVKAN